MKKLGKNIHLYMASMGKIFRVMAVCADNNEANNFCAKNTNCGVIAADDNGLVYVAELYGKTIKSSPLIEFMEK